MPKTHFFDGAAALVTAPLTDNLPSGLSVGGSASTTCMGGSVSTTPSSVTLDAGASIPAGGSCTITVPVFSTIGGNYINELPPGTLSTNFGSNTGTASATLNVNSTIQRPTVGKSFDPVLNSLFTGTSPTITLNNPSGVISNITSFTDTLPAGLTIPNNASVVTNCGGVVNHTATSVSLGAGNSIPAGGSCTITIDMLIATEAHNYQNTVHANELQTSTGSNLEAATATFSRGIIGDSPPVVGKGFSPSTVNAGVATTLVIVLGSFTPNINPILTADFTDNLPSGVVTVAGTEATTCSAGVVSNTSNSITLQAGAVIPDTSTCTVSVDVVAAIGGNYDNTIPANALITDHGNNAEPTVATLNVNSTDLFPNVGKAFSPEIIPVGGSSTVTITFNNPNSSGPATISPAFVDTFPVGVTLSNAVNNGCNGVLTIDGGGTTLTLTGGSIPQGGSCNIQATVTAASIGYFTNTIAIGDLQTIEFGDNTDAASVTLTVVPANPTISKFFSPVNMS